MLEPMWPFRPERLTDVMPPADVRHILGLGTLVGSAVTLVETRSNGHASIDAGEGEAARADPFCSYFRHGLVGSEPAFRGADAACARCEQAFARRVLSPAPAGSPAPPGGGSTGANSQPLRLRCHMGLMDFLMPVRVSGKTVAGLIAGRRVESEEDRQRIRKSAGKIGKLTRAEAESAASSDRILVEPHDERARERLIEEIARIPLRSPSWSTGSRSSRSSWVDWRPASSTASGSAARTRSSRRSTRRPAKRSRSLPT